MGKRGVKAIRDAHKANNEISFSQWKRSSYSVFSTLGKAVRIAVLAIVYVLNLAPLKAQVDTVEVLREHDYQLEEVEVMAERTPLAMSEAARLVTVITRKDIAAAGFGSIDELLELFGGIDQRQRGPGGIQSDISINGGSFEQVMVLLNGININDPQTGHFHMDIPVPLVSIERIEIIRGSAARVLGPNAFSGAINIVTRKPEANALSVGADYGQYKYRKASMFAGTRIKSSKIGLAAEYAGTSGYRENTDSKNGSAYVNWELLKKAHSLNIQAGANKKDFGANAFYSPSFPDQYEKTASLFSALSWNMTGRLNQRHDIYLRYHRDEFHLFRYESPSWYTGPNNHLSRVAGSQHNFWFDTKLGRTSFGADLRSENLWSNVLGDSISDQRTAPNNAVLKVGGVRNHASIFAEQRWGGPRLQISGGLLAHLYKGISSEMFYYPGLDISYRVLPELKLYLNISKSLRLPSFTEMYYTSPTHRGNRDLLPETSLDYTVGSKYARNNYQLNTSVNARWSENSIDWVRASADDPWETMNSGDFFTLSFDNEFIVRNFDIGDVVKKVNLKLSYHYTYQDKNTSSLDSKYIRDYLKHKAVLQSGFSFLRFGRIYLGLQWADRAGEYTDWDEDDIPFQRPYDPFIIADLRMNWKMGRSSFNIRINNLFNKQYADFGHIWQPGRWVILGLAYEI